MESSTRLTIIYTSKDFSIDRLDDPAWDGASKIVVSKYWSGTMASIGRWFSAKPLWSDTALYVRFEANQTEPLVVGDKPNLKTKTIGLWDRDVCEIFIAPDTSQRSKYFEFEIAPTGEWVDLAIEFTPRGRKTDLEYESGMASAAKIERDKVLMAIRIPFASLGKTPKAGDVWLGNLFRCVGQGPTRGYLAWQPTRTEEPSFHAPAAFGEIEFLA